MITKITRNKQYKEICVLGLLSFLCFSSPIHAREGTNISPYGAISELHTQCDRPDDLAVGYELDPTTGRYTLQCQSIAELKVALGVVEGGTLGCPDGQIAIGVTRDRRALQCQAILQDPCPVTQAEVDEINRLHRVGNLTKDQICRLESVVLNSNYWTSYGRIRNLNYSQGEASEWKTTPFMTQIPSGFAKIPTLRKFVLANTSVTEIPERLGRLPLSYLEIDTTPVTSLPESLGTNPKLEQLTLYGTQISSLPGSFGSGTMGLKHMDISSNPRLTSLSADFGYIPELQTLNIDNNRSLQYLPESFGSLSKLQGSRNEYNFFSNCGTRNRNGFFNPCPAPNKPTVVGLDLSNNNLAGLPTSFAQLTQLKGVYLDGNPLGQIYGLEPLARLPNLEILTLGNTQINTMIAREVDLPKLKYLLISGASTLQYIGKKINLPQLNTLYVWGTGLRSFEDLNGGSHNVMPLQDYRITNNRITHLSRNLVLSLNNATQYSIARSYGAIGKSSEEISYAGNGAVLDLSYNMISEVPTYIDLLKNVVSINLSFNPVYELPRSVENMTNVKHIQLRTLGVTDITTGRFVPQRTIPKNLELLPAESIDLSSNDFSSGLEFANGFSSLKYLNLINSKISEFPRNIKTMSQLQSLMMQVNPVTTIGSEIGSLSELVSLHITSHVIKSIPRELSTLPKLERLNLSDGLITGVPDNLGMLRSLKELDLSSNTAFGDRDLEQIVNISSLEELRLSSRDPYSSLYIRTIPGSISQLTKLRILQIASEKITSIPSELSLLQALTDLDLSSNPLEKLPDNFDQLKTLKYLNLTSYKPYSIEPDNKLGALNASWQSPTGYPFIRTEYGITPSGYGISIESFGNNVPIKITSGIRACGLTGTEVYELNTLTSEQKNDTEWCQTTRLTATGKSLSSVPSGIRKLSSLTEIDLSYNLLSGSISREQFPKRLQILNLSHNRITSYQNNFALSENGTRFTTQLRELDLSHNQLQIYIGSRDENGSYYGGRDMTQEQEHRLEKLDLSHNQLTQVSVAGHYPYVSYDAQGNKYHHYQPWMHYPSLRELDISNNPLKNLDTFMTLYTTVERIDMTNVGSGGVSPAIQSNIQINSLSGSIIGVQSVGKMGDRFDGSYDLFISRGANGRLKLDKTLSIVNACGLTSQEISELNTLIKDEHSGQQWCDRKELRLFRLPDNLEFYQYTYYLGLGYRGAPLTKIPLAITKLKNLEILDLGGHHLSLPDSIPREMSNLTNLKILSLRSSGLSHFPEALTTLTNLQTLSINNQKCMMIGPRDQSRCFDSYAYIPNNIPSLSDSIGALQKLETIELDNIGLGSLGSGFANIRTLSGTLDLSSNQLSGVETMLPMSPNIKILKLQNNRLISIPDDISNYPILQELDAQKNQISFVSAEIGNLSLLRLLILSDNSLSSIPREVGDLVSLQNLNLDRNHLSRFPEDVTRLSGLRHLQLEENQIQGVLPTSMSGMIALSTLLLAHNQITEIPAGVFDLRLNKISIHNNKLQNLTSNFVNIAHRSGSGGNSGGSIDISHNEIQTLPEDVIFWGKGSPVHVDLSYNLLRELPEDLGSSGSWARTSWISLNASFNQLETMPTSMSGMTRLEGLDLRSNKLTSLPEIFASGSLIKDLKLAGNQLTSLPESIGSLRGVRELDLSKNQLQTLPASIQNMSALERLYLQENRLTSLPESISLIPNLNILHITKNPTLTTLPQNFERLSNKLTELFLKETGLGNIAEDYQVGNNIQKNDRGYTIEIRPNIGRIQITKTP